MIIKFYKDLEALGLTLEAMRRQAYTNFVVVIAEDNDAEETRSFLKRLYGS
ncbi:hypothetical protein ACFL3A_00305 [Pseudomonadota bacterium]